MTQVFNSNMAREVSSHSKLAILFSRIKRKFLKNIVLARISIVLILLLVFILTAKIGEYLIVRSNFSKYKDVLIGFIFTPESKLKTFASQTTLLIMGKSGAAHAGPDLTDTMIFASISIPKKSITLVSIPRDIWIPSIRAKINSSYYWGNQREAGGGLILSKSIVEEIIGVPVQYALVIDFSKFREMIDLAGGVEVNVERTFTDNKYPVPGRENDLCNGDKLFKCRYETIHFEKGSFHLDGVTALKFVRSRNAEGEEGTDIAREARQQKVILAVKDKILNPKILLSPTKLITLLKFAEKSVETDLGNEGAGVLGRKILESRNNIKSFVFPSEFLINPPVSSLYDNQYVFMPKSDSWETLHKWVTTILQ